MADYSLPDHATHPQGTGHPEMDSPPDVIDAACRVAGTVAARRRGDIEGARILLSSFDSHEELASGALLVAELALQALSDANGEGLDVCVGILNQRLRTLPR